MWADSSVRPPLRLPVSLAISNLEDLGAYGGVVCFVLSDQKLRTSWRSQTAGESDGCCGLPLPPDDREMFTHTRLHVIPEAGTLSPPGSSRSQGPCCTVGRSGCPAESREGLQQKQLPALAPSGSQARGGGWVGV